MNYLFHSFSLTIRRLSEIANSVGFRESFNATDLLTLSGPVRGAWKFATRSSHTSD